MAMVILSASVERFSVSRMRDFYYCFGFGARGSAAEYVLYFKCHRIYYNGSVTKYTIFF